MFGIDDIIIGIAIVLAATAVVVVVVDYLSSSFIRNKLKTDLPQSSYGQLEDIINSNEATIGPTYRISARDRNGTKLNTYDFQCKRSEYFYRGEKISVY